MGGDFEAVRPLSARDIEEYVIELRSAFRLGNRKVDMAQLIESFLPAILEDEYHWEVLPDDDMPGMEGFATGGGKRSIYLSNSTYEALAIGEPNACFVAAHEFGHMALHSHQTPVLAKRAYKDHRFDPEWQADRFADYWLTPTEGVRQCRSANHVAAKFGVSDEMARRRFDEVKNQGIQGELF